MTSIRILYEDQAAAGEFENFGPHRLVCACVADRVPSLDPWRIPSRLACEPRKGNAKLLRACELHAVRDHDAVIFALFDGDRLHLVLGMPATSTVEDMTAQLHVRIRSPRVRPFLLERDPARGLRGNLEDVVQAAAECIDPPIETPIPKEHNERDIVLNRAAKPYNRAVRDCITVRVPSFGGFVEAIADQLLRHESE